MTARQFALAIVGCVLAGVVAIAADDPQLGTWKLNEAKSKIGAGTAKNSTVVYVAAGDSVKVTVDGVDGSGKPAHNEWTGKFDGKDYPVTGEPTADTRSYKKLDAHTLSFAQKKDGKMTISGKIVVSGDGKTRTVTTTTTTADGKKVSSTAVYDKQ
jgi:endonuclease YncB( thermonuclease family)